MITEELLKEHNYKKTPGIRRDKSDYCKGSWMKTFSDNRGIAFNLQFEVWEFPSDEKKSFTFHTCLRSEVIVFNISSPVFAHSITDVESSVMKIWGCLGSEYLEKYTGDNHG